MAVRTPTSVLPCVLDWQQLWGWKDCSLNANILETCLRCLNQSFNSIVEGIFRPAVGKCNTSRNSRQDRGNWNVIYGLEEMKPLSCLIALPWQQLVSETYTDRRPSLQELVLRRILKGLMLFQP